MARLHTHRFHLQLKLLGYFFSSVLLLLLSGQDTHAQQYHFKKFDEMDGLPSGAFYRLIEDENGKLILATLKGVSTYDGDVFKTFGEKEGLTEKRLFHVQKDTIEDCLWFLGEKHLVKYKRGTFTTYTEYTGFCWMDIDPVTGEKWLMNRMGKIFSLRNDKLTFFASFKLSPQQLKGYDANNLAVTFVTLGNGAFIVGAQTGFYYISKARQIQLPAPMHYLKTYIYARVFKRLNGNILLGSDQGIYEFNPSTFKTKLLLTLVQSEVISFYEDKKRGDAWVGTIKGLYHFRDGKISDHGGEWLLDGHSVNCIVKDAEDTYWFGTRTNGVFACSIEAVHYRAGNFFPHFLGYDQGRVYGISVQGDMHYIERDRLHHYANPNGKRNFGNDASIRSAYQLKQGGVMISSYAGHSYSLISGKITECTQEFRIPQEKSELFWGNVEQGKLTHNINNGGVVYSDEKVVKYLTTPEQHEWIEKNYSFLYKQGGGYYYFDRYANHYFFDKESKNFYVINTSRKKVTYKQFYLGSLPNHVVGMLNDSVIVISTEDKGIAILYNNTLSWITKNDGLISDYCNMVESNGPYVWVGTNSGLSRILLTRTGEVKEISNFTANNTLLTNDVKDVLVVGDSIYVASSAGITVFNKNYSVPVEQYRCFIEKLAVNNHDTMIRSGYVFPHDRNNLTITLGQSSKQLRNNVYYRYTLSPATDSPVVITSNGLNFASLEPGIYQLSLWGRNLNGMWSAKPTLFDFRITPPYWKTWWFRVLLGIIGVGIVTVIMYSFQRRKRKQEEITRKLVESDLRSLRLHMNPHFIFNSLTSLQSFIVTNKTNKAEEYISRFSEMIRSVMGYSVSGEITLAEEIQLLTKYIELELVRFEDQFTYEIITAENIEPETTIIPSLLIQPIVENAIKHGLTGMSRKGNMKLHFEYEKEYLYCTVEDNGRGRSDATATFNKVSGHVSTGVKFTEERIRLLVKDASKEPIVITDLTDNGEPAGTRVKILIPVLE